jgi:hypothetical protein
VQPVVTLQEQLRAAQLSARHSVGRQSAARQHKQKLAEACLQRSIQVGNRQQGTVQPHKQTPALKLACSAAYRSAASVISSVGVVRLPPAQQWVQAQGYSGRTAGIATAAAAVAWQAAVR